MSVFPFEKLGRHSFLKVSHGDKVTIVRYSHVIDVKQNGFGNHVYGWDFNEREMKDSLPQHRDNLGMRLEIVVKNVDNKPVYMFYGKPCTFEVAKYSELEPLVFVQFKKQLLPTILQENVTMYHDYEEQGLMKLSYTPSLIRETETGMAELQEGEFLVIKSKDYDKITANCAIK